MKTYKIEVQVTNVDGHQCFNVDANSREEALTLHQDGQSVLTDEVLDVTGIERAGIEDVSEV